MKKIASILLKKLISVIVRTKGTEGLGRFVVFVARHAGLDLLNIAYREMGILKYENYSESGELFLVKDVLSQGLCDRKSCVIFDVGANVGNYTKLIGGLLKDATIYAFEPNMNSFSSLDELGCEKVRCFNLGFGAGCSQGKLYTYKDSLDSSHASTYRNIFGAFYKKDDIASIDFELRTVDSFCKEYGIEFIDFMKIDTEGNELNVLNGARGMIDNGRICTMQFEFGECGVFSRVFLKDFYDILTGYDFYRLDSERLIPLGEYSVKNEIFRYQNIFATRKDMDSNLIQ